MSERLRPHFASLPVQCIVNEYLPGQGIGMHSDHRDFGPIVASLSLGADWPMCFRPSGARPYRASAAPRRPDRNAAPPLRLLLTGASRHAWMHGIDRTQSARQSVTRISATYRTLSG